jgi:hypothetical protein
MLSRGPCARPPTVIRRTSTASTGEVWATAGPSSVTSAPPRPVTRTGPPDYVLFMLSTLLVIGGVLVGLLVLLAVIVGLSARPAPSTVNRTGGRAPAWVADAGRPHPDAWSPLSTGNTSEMPAVR